MTKKNLLLILIIAFVLSFTIAILIYSQSIVLARNNLKIDVTVLNESSKIGLTIDTDGLRFGELPLNGVGKRTIIITNTWDKPVKVFLDAKADFKEWIRFEKNNFWLQPEENYELAIMMTIPADANPGYYEGQIIILFLR